MTYRIHFGVADLARTRVADSPRPLLELSIAVRQLQERSHPMRLGAWRHRALAGLHPRSRMVLDLIPNRGWSPTFLGDPVAGTPWELLDRLRATSRARLRDELLETAGRAQSLPGWARLLPGDAELMRQLCDGVEYLHDRLLAPYWDRISSLAAADHAQRARQVLTGGVESLLASVNPRRICWNAPVLEVTMASGLDGDLHLDGRGLLLVPSVFALDAPVIDPDAQPQPVLTYPVLPHEPVHALVLFAPRAAASDAPLAGLLGRTRAAVLSAVAEHPGCSTKELAALIGIAKASASEHATTLRNAGLIATTRHRDGASHTATVLGVTLLDAGRPRTCPSTPPRAERQAPSPRLR